MCIKLNILKPVKIINKLILFFISIFIFGFSYSFALDDNKKTISELKNNIKELEADKKHVNFVFSASLKEYWGIKKFLKSNLSKENINFIILKINKYKAQKKEIDAIIKLKNNTEEDLWKKVVELRKKLYIKIRPYILDSKIELFNKFIEKDILRIEKNYIISSNIKEVNKTLDKKVKTIKWKILENQINISEKLDYILEKKIRMKILIFKNSKNFKDLSDSRKKIIFKLVIKKIDEKLVKIDYKKDSKKILIYKMMRKILLEM